MNECEHFTMKKDLEAFAWELAKISCGRLRDEVGRAAENGRY